MRLRRVLKEGGTAILIVPRKEDTFDHLRGTSRLEHLLFPFVHNVSESDTQHANVLNWVLGADLDRGMSVFRRR